MPFFHQIFHGPGGGVHIIHQYAVKGIFVAASVQQYDPVFRAGIGFIILLEHLCPEKHHRALHVRQNVVKLFLIIRIMDVHITEYRFIAHELCLVLYAFDHGGVKGAVIDDQPVPPEYHKPDLRDLLVHAVAQLFRNL